MPYIILYILYPFTGCGSAFCWQRRRVYTYSVSDRGGWQLAWVQWHKEAIEDIYAVHNTVSHPSYSETACCMQISVHDCF